MAVPTKDSLLLNWATNFNTRGTASPVTFGLVAAQMTAFTAVYTPFVTAYNASNMFRPDGDQCSLTSLRMMPRRKA